MRRLSWSPAFPFDILRNKQQRTYFVFVFFIWASSFIVIRTGVRVWERAHSLSHLRWNWLIRIYQLNSCSLVRVDHFCIFVLTIHPSNEFSSLAYCLRKFHRPIRVCFISNCILDRSANNWKFEKWQEKRGIENMQWLKVHQLNCTHFHYPVIKFLTHILHSSLSNTMISSVIIITFEKWLEIIRKCAEFTSKYEIFKCLDKTLSPKIKQIADIHIGLVCITVAVSLWLWRRAKYWYVQNHFLFILVESISKRSSKFNISKCLNLIKRDKNPWKLSDQFGE